MTEIQARLFALRDEKFRKFNSKLIPTVAPETVIGVRTPALRALAKELRGTETAARLMETLPHEYFEEYALHAFLIENIGDYAECVAALERFLPYVDNWATCDQLNPKVLGAHRAELMGNILRWITSEHIYTRRYAIGLLMRWYLGADFRTEYADMAAAADDGSFTGDDKYYLNMMQAWYFATALAKNYNEALPYLEKRRLAPWTHNRTIQKAIESYRVTDEHKAYLRTLRVRADGKA